MAGFLSPPPFLLGSESPIALNVNRACGSHPGQGPRDRSGTRYLSLGVSLEASPASAEKQRETQQSQQQDEGPMMVNDCLGEADDYLEYGN